MKRVKRGLSLLMSLLLCVTGFNLGLIAHANGQDAARIIGFNQLDEGIATQTLPIGASLEDVVLPESIQATVETVEQVEVRKPVEITAEESVEEPAEETVVEYEDKAEEPTDVQTEEIESDEPALTEEIVEPEAETDEPVADEEATDETTEPAEEPESSEQSDSTDESIDIGLLDILFPPIVAKAAELEVSESGTLAGVTAAVAATMAETEYETVVETKTVQSEITIENVKWEPSDGASFDTSKVATYTFTPVFNTDYVVATAVPTIKVNIVNVDSKIGFDKSVVVDGVRISVKADEGVFPEEATLLATKVYGEDLQAVEAAVEEERTEDKNKVESYTFDIKVLDKDGNEIEPDNSKGQVKVSFTLEEVAEENLETDVYHVKGEVGDLSVDRLETTETATKTVEAITDGFSFYTVEFTYNDLQYVMNGDTTVPLKEILDTVGLQGEVTGVVSDAPELFSITKESGDWFVAANQAFSTTQYLTVTINDRDYVIMVTDDQNVLENDGYPYGKSFSYTSVTLSVKVAAGATNATYQWKSGTSKDNLTNISGATNQDYVVDNPTSGTWYACTVNGNTSKAIQIVKPGEDGRTWTGSGCPFYISNDTMAYSISGSTTERKFDIVGKYVKNNVTYMLQTSCGGNGWEMKSSDNASPNGDGGKSSNVQLDDIYFAFSEEDDYQLYVTADLAEGQQAFSFGCDTQLGNYETSSEYADSAALKAFLMNGDELDYVAMVGAESFELADASNPAILIMPIYTTGLKYWLGGYYGRTHYAYNLNDDGSVVNEFSGDSGMTMSWSGVPSGGEIKFLFSVGDASSTGAVDAGSNTELEPLPEGETTDIDTSARPVVDGLDAEAEALAQNGDSVRLNLIVAPKGNSKASESNVLKNDEQLHNKVKSQYKDEEFVSVEVLEIDIEKYINNEQTSNLTETNQVLEIEIGYNFNDKYDPVVIRKHGDEEQVFTALSSRPTEGYVDATFYADTENNKLYIYSNKFSTYLLAYSEVEGNAVVPSSGGTSGSASYPSTVPVYRLFNSKTGTHFFTADKLERDTLLTSGTANGWTDEGIAFQTQVKSGTPVYRVFDLNNGKHVYTSDVAERDAYVANGYRDEGIAWYAPTVTGRIVYKITNPKNSSILYTTSDAEASALVNAGFTCEEANFSVY